MTVAVLFSQGGSYSQNYGDSQVNIASHRGFVKVLTSMMTDQYNDQQYGNVNSNYFVVVSLQSGSSSSQNYGDNQVSRP